MNARDLLTELQSLGIELTPRGDRLHVRAPAGVVDYSLRERLAAAKLDLLRLLSDRAGPPYVWRFLVDGKPVTAIDPDRCTRAEQMRRLGLKFGPGRVSALVRQGHGE